MNGDITDIKLRLAADCDRVCEHLLPAGVSKSGEWSVGSVGGEKGESLKIRLKGNKAGIWSDFATGQAGDLIDLWAAVRGSTLVETLDEIRGYFGIERPTFHREKKREYTKPKKPKGEKPQAKVKDYLVEDRNISGEVMNKYRIGENGDKIIFPFFRDDELVMAKTRAAEDGASPKPTEAGCEKILFGWQAIDANARQVVITEGEIDALSMSCYGWDSLSVPFGGGKGAKQDWIENEFDNLARFDTIYLCMDNDQAGQEATEEIASRLGRHRCKVVELPHKDINECLMEGVAIEEITRCVLEARSLDPSGLRRVKEFEENVLELFFPKDGEEPGYLTPYASLGERLRFRPSEVTVWSGASGSGKSQLLSDCTVDFVRQGSKVCMASLEMTPAMTLKRMVKQAGGTGNPTEKLVGDVLTWLDEGLLIFDLVGKTSVDTLIEVFDYAAKKYGCDQFVIDSLMRLGLETDDYNEQEAVMYRIVDWAIDAGVHVHFVCHSRKTMDGGQPKTEDIKGAMEIGANAFNILTVWRNRRREEALEDPHISDEDREEFEKKWGVVLTVAKQRNGDYEGKIGLWFDLDNYQYRSSLCSTTMGARMRNVA